MSSIYAKKILIIENDQALANSLVTELTIYGYECFLSYDPEIVLSGLPQLRPDLLIIDVSMTAIDGFSIFERIRGLSDKALADTPAIIISATGDLVEISRAIKLRISDYFVKATFDPKQSAQKVKKLLGDGSPSSTTVAPAKMEEAQVLTKLLIVEDDKFLRDLAAQKLSKEHLQVFTAVDGEQGVAVAEKEIPDIILLDILLPGIDGFEVLKRIRANPALQKTHVSMLSNFGQREDIERAIAAGADQFMVKANYTLDEIVQEVKKIIATPRPDHPATP
jgi:DNA-binding response OmpR family regulator